MARNRILVPFPPDVIADIDKIVSHGKRAAFLVDLAKREIQRQRLLKIFENQEPIWKDEDHPELADGAAAWVRKVRAKSEERFQRDQRDREDS